MGVQEGELAASLALENVVVFGAGWSVFWVDFQESYYIIMFSVIVKS